jgi:hypothetical protein
LGIHELWNLFSPEEAQLFFATLMSNPLIMGAKHQPSISSATSAKVRDRSESRTSALISYLILALGLLTSVIGSRMILGAISDVPLNDEWFAVHAIASAPNHQLPISWIWSQHNEHRILFYRLLLLADIHLLHGRHWIEFWSILLSQWASFGLLIWVVLLGCLGSCLTRAMIGLGAFCLFCPTQWENFTCAFQISFLLPTFFLLLALLALFKYHHQIAESRYRYLGLSLLAATASTAAQANGVLIWPVLVIAAALLGMRGRILVLYAVSGGVLLGLYLYHYASPPVHADPIKSIQHPVLLLRYIASYMGLNLPPWFRSRSIVAELTGMIGIIGGLILLAVVFLVPRWHNPLSIAFASLMLFSLGTAFMTGLGRLGLGVLGSRYQTVNLLFWLGAIGLCLMIADQTLPRLRNVVLVAVPLAILAAISQFHIVLNAGRMLTLQAEVGALAPLTGIPDRSTLLALDPWNPEAVWEDVPYLKEQRLFMFSAQWVSQMNQPLARFYDVESTGACKGQMRIEHLSAKDLIADDAGEDLRVAGWAVSGPEAEPAEKLLIVADGHIVGLGIGGLQPGAGKPFLMERGKSFLMQRKFIDWSGLARVSSEVRSIDLYAVDRRQSRQVCLVASAAIP